MGVRCFRKFRKNKQFSLEIPSGGATVFPVIPIYLNIGSKTSLYDNAEVWATRIHTVGLRLEDVYWSQEDVDAAVGICDRTGSTIGLSCSPFHSWSCSAPLNYVFPQPIGTDPGDHVGYETEYALELSKYDTLCDEMIAALGSRVDLVSAILVNIEYWDRVTNAAYKTEIGATFDEVRLALAAKFPLARIEFYGQGIIWDGPHSYWMQTETYNPSYGIACSAPNYPAEMESWFNQTVALAITAGVTDITPWVHIGGGYGLFADPYYSPLTVTTANAIRFGAFLKASPYVKCIVLQPGPAEPPTSQWLDHFTAFMTGLGQ